MRTSANKVEVEESQADRAASKRPSSRLLLVEDETLIRLSLAEFLQDRGYEVLEAANLAEAQALLLSTSNIDVVFSDIQMLGPDDGIRLARWVHERFPGIHVILASGNLGALTTAKSQCHSIHASSSKPFTHEQALDLVRSAFERCASDQ
jgi:DNA-binding NtrC family response regulator